MRKHFNLLDRIALTSITAALAAASAGASMDSRPSPTEPPGADRPLFTLYFSAVTDANATPCGCRGSRAGGIARRITLQMQWDEQKDGPAFWIDGGNTCVFDSKQEIETSQLILDAMKKMHYSAVAAGAADLSSESGDWNRTLGTADLPFTSVNLRLRDTGERIFPPYRLIEVPSPAGPAPIGKPLRVAIIGVTDPGGGGVGDGPDRRTLVVTDAAKELRSILPEVRSRADLIVATIASDRNSLAPYLFSSVDIDLLLVGAHQIFDTPQVIGRTTVFRSGDRGRYIVKIPVRRSATGDGFAFAFDTIHLDEKVVPEDPETAVVLEAAVSRFNEDSRSIMKAHAAAAPPVSIAPYVGVTKCSECHVDAYTIWSKSRHAHALESLAEKQRDYTKLCVFCHVTGWDKEGGGGFVDPASTPALIDVQCEACHGPGADHVSSPKVPYGQVSTPDRCQHCHDPQNSANFEFGSYWERIAH